MYFKYCGWIIVTRASTVLHILVWNINRYPYLKNEVGTKSNKSESVVAERYFTVGNIQEMYTFLWRRSNRESLTFLRAWIYFSKKYQSPYKLGVQSIFELFYIITVICFTLLTFLYYELSEQVIVFVDQRWSESTHTSIE